MKILDAAYETLKEMGRPLHSRDLTERMIASGRWDSESDEREKSVIGRISMDIREQGKQSRFKRTRPGWYALNVPTPPNPPAPAGPQPKLNHLTFLDAAEQVLQEAGRHLHFKEITKRALDQDLIVSYGPTPEHSMNAAIGREIKQRLMRGEVQRFRRVGKGFIDLEESDEILQRIQRHNNRIRAELLEQLHQIDPTEFEHLIGRLLEALDFIEVSVTSKSNDSGIDVLGTLVVGNVVKIKMAVQVKRWKKKKNIQAPIVQQVRGSLRVHEQGLIITTSDFSPGARREAESPNASPVALMNGQELINLMIEHQILVHREPHHLLRLGDPDDE